MATKSCPNAQSVAIDHLAAIKTGCSFGIFYNYIDYKDPENQTGLRISSNLLKQLLARERFAPPSLEPLYQKWSQDSLRPESGAIREIFLASMRRYTSVYILLDALDECEFENQNDLFVLIQQCLEFDARVLVTSRPHLPMLERLFERSATLDIVASEDNIERFLRCKLEPIYHIASSLKEKIIEKLLSIGRGM